MIQAALFAVSSPCLSGSWPRSGRSQGDIHFRCRKTRPPSAILPGPNQPKMLGHVLWKVAYCWPSVRVTSSVHRRTSVASVSCLCSYLGNLASHLHRDLHGGLSLICIYMTCSQGTLKGKNRFRSLRRSRRRRRGRRTQVCLTVNTYIVWETTLRPNTVAGMKAIKTKYGRWHGGHPFDNDGSVNYVQYKSKYVKLT